MYSKWWTWSYKFMYPVSLPPPILIESIDLIRMSIIWQNRKVKKLDQTTDMVLLPNIDLIILLLVFTFPLI